MNNIQQLILDTYKEKPKHFTQILKRNPEVIAYLKDHASHIDTFLEQLYYVVYNESNICQHGSVKPLKTFAGYSFCGKTGKCQCARESVGISVSKTKQQYTTEEKEQINKKREETTLKKYGVTNNGQTSVALANHLTFYNDEKKVSRVTSQIRRTKLANHGDENFNNREKAEETCIKKHGVRNTWSLRDDKQNPNLEILKDKEQLKKLYTEASVEEISEKLNVHLQTVYRYLRETGVKEPYKSTFEQEIGNFLRTLGITDIVSNKRTIIGKELDIFIPAYNLAIEYNGVYWHHDRIDHITRDYHRNKFLECEKKGIELFTIFSDSWDSKKAIWKNKIISKLGLVENKIYARNTHIVELKSSETRQILDDNHVQGYCNAQYCYGLMYDNKLVAVMTFSNKRAGIGKDRGTGSYELVRYVTSTTVPGGASKLLKHFIRVHEPKLIISYSDNRYSVGNLYKTLGFELEKSNPAGYGYYDPQEKKMYHRYKFAKFELVKQGFDPSKTEFQIMDELGYMRIWNCGTKTWVLNIN